MDSLKRLNTLYKIHDQYFRATFHACEKFCAHCCTVNVTATSLEGRYILHHVKGPNRGTMLNAFSTALPRQRYRPRLTINGFAAACMADVDIPKEENNPQWGSCPMLSNNACTIYDYRPMGCRIMSSRTICCSEEGGEAHMDDITVTINQIFLQYVEHMDRGGVFGNMTDIIQFLVRTSEGSHRDAQAFRLLQNREAPFLMIPPEHRQTVMPILQDIQKNVFG